MNPDQRKQVEAYLQKKRFREQTMAKGLWKIEDESQIEADLTKENPVIGIRLNGMIQPTGHGNLKVPDIQRDVEQILKKEKLDAGKMAGLGTQKLDELKKSKTTATCAGCKNSFESTMTELQQIDEKYHGLFCPKCIALSNTGTQAKGIVPATPEPAKAVKIPICRKCGIEVSNARALECFQNNEPCTHEDCGEQKGGGNMSAERDETEGIKDAEIVDKNLPAVPKKKTEFQTGTCEAVALQYGIPAELSKLFFMTMDGGLYIKNPGLLYLAGKKGYSRIEVTTTYDEKAQEWSAECKIYPKLTKDILEGISKLDKDIQKTAFEFATQPTNGTGRASKGSVRMSTMHAFLKEMSQTRAQNRALRAFTGYGGTSAEELPEALIERD